MNTSHHYLVDKEHPLPSWYVPTDLVEAPIPFLAAQGDPKTLMCAVACDALSCLVQGSLKEGLNLYGISAYRSYQRQKEIYDQSISKKGLDHTKKYIAAPGTSEHQTGLAIDLSTLSVDYDLIEEFAYTQEGIWLNDNVSKYGFKISYPLGKELVTGYQYEPWHIFYESEDAVFFDS